MNIGEIIILCKGEMKMKLRTKKMLSLLLASAMVFTMNTTVFAEEVPADVDSVDEIFAEEAVEVLTSETNYSESDNSASDNSASNNKVSPNAAASVRNAALISENLAQVEEDLKNNTFTPISGNSYTFTIRYSQALPYEGKKFELAGSKKVTEGKATGVDVQIIYTKGSKVSTNGISDNVAASDNKIVVEDGWTDITDAIKSVKIKSSKGATVQFDGTGIAVAKDCTYIQDIKLDKKKLENDFKLSKEDIKAIEKDLKTQMKESKKAISKDKTRKVSANGIASDGKDDTGFIIPVYPAFVNDGSDGNKAEAEKVEAAGLSVLTIGDLTSKKVVKLDKKDTTGASVKSIQGTWSVSGKTKKVTLKPDKVQSGKATKYNGLFTEVEKAKVAKGEVVKGADGKETGAYTVEASGNFFGFIEYTPANDK